MKRPGRDLIQTLSKEQVAGYVFILPFILGFLAFTVIPIATSLVLSFTSFDLLSAPKFVGLENYIRMFTKDPTFWKSLGVTFFYASVSVPLRLAMALAVAVALYRTSRMTSIYRAVYYLPSIIGSSVAVAVLWKRLFATDGTLNGLLAAVGLPSNTAWLASVDTAIWTLIILAVWQFGSSMLIFLAGLKQIPVSLYEAADIDGANAFGKFFRITMPMLTPVIFFNLIMQMINGFMAFTQSYIITNGRPLDSTLFYVVYMHRRSFRFYELGYSSAMAWVMLVIISVLTIVIFKTSNRWVYYQSE